MEILGSVKKDRVYAEWLKSERYRVRKILDAEQIALIETPNFDDPEENYRREMMLLHIYRRMPILKKLPERIDWCETRIHHHDLKNLFILPVWDWFLDSGRTFQLLDAPAHLSHGRGSAVPRLGRMTNHLRKIEAMDFSADDDWGHLILISSRSRGPYTIIDGTHRAVKMLVSNRLAGSRCFLGLNNDMKTCPWSIEREDLSAHRATLSDLARQGFIW